MKVVFSLRAQRDLLAQIDWLEERSPKAARAAADQIARAVQLLGDFPLSAPVVDQHHHELVVRFGRDGFIFRYRMTADTVTITRLFHGRMSRRPR